MIAMLAILAVFIGWGVYSIYFRPTRARMIAFGVICMALACICCIGALSDNDPYSLGLVAIFGVLFLATIARMKHVKTSDGRLYRCVDCSYDLRGHLPDKCPECGEVLNPNQS